MEGGRGKLSFFSQPIGSFLFQVRISLITLWLVYRDFVLPANGPDASDAGTVRWRIKPLTSNFYYHRAGKIASYI